MATENIVLLLVAVALGGLHLFGGPLSGARSLARKEDVARWRSERLKRKDHPAE